jgi:hypothetical protein
MKIKLIVLFVTLAFLANPALAKKDKNKGLPPGLAKNQERGKPLPPGWQKKLHRGDVISADIYSHATIVVPVNKHGLITVSIEGHLFRLEKTTRKIVKILD